MGMQKGSKQFWALVDELGQFHPETFQPEGWENVSVVSAWRERLARLRAQYGVAVVSDALQTLNVYGEKR